MATSAIVTKLKERGLGLARWAVERGAPPAWFGYRFVKREPAAEYIAQRAEGSAVETVHPEQTFVNPLPENVASREALPKEPGWWGYSFWDVPARTSAPTFRATLHDCRVVPHVDPEDGEFYVGILDARNRAVELREVAFRRPSHARKLASAGQGVRVKRATWVIERVYHNYSHWLTAHLPKLLLLRERGELADVYLPARRPAFVDASLRLYGMDPERFPTFDPAHPLEVDELTVWGTDRFRPELLRFVREACPLPAPDTPRRRVYISRQRAERRRLLNEEEIWPLLAAAGFERVFMEELGFEEQVQLMRETAVLFAPHGAGLTNMVFCPPRTHVVEIASRHFPNPNFYALAAAVGHPYSILFCEAVGETHPLLQDLHVSAAAVEGILARLPS